MGISLNWLREYIDIEWPGDELVEKLTRAGIAFEGAEAEGDDWIMETDLTPNRGDCQGYINLAREVGALNGKSVKMPELSLSESTEEVDKYIKVTVEEPELCRRYAARLIKNVKIGPSPEWMQERLIKSGIRPINNVVDITNYVMLECNQPLHAFDYDLLEPQKHIIVRRAYPGEKFITLDDVERQLDEDMLLITEGGRAVALAGIMGGQNTEINDNTVNVLLESAHFDGICIRKTSRKLALRSDSSVRFGKGTDVEGCVFAADRAAALMQDHAGGQVASGVCDCYPGRREALKVSLRKDRVNHVLGTSMTSVQIGAFLDALHMQHTVADGVFQVTIPSYRPDMTIEEDLIEEVARLYGYDNIPATLPVGPSTQGVLNQYQKLQDRVKSIMDASMYEIVCYTFIHPGWDDLLMLPADSPRRNSIRVANPLSEDQSVMRTLLLPGMLDTVSRNQARQNENLAFFEMGNVFFPSDGPLADEYLKLGGVANGTSPDSWMRNPVEMDFYYLKGIIENLLFELGIDTCAFTASNEVYLHPGRTARIVAGGVELGWLGEIHPQVQERFGIKGRTAAFELDMASLLKLWKPRKMTRIISKYPSVDRDIAVMVDKLVRAADMLAIIQDNGGEYLRSVNIADVYTGVQIPDGMKSIAFKLNFQAADNTLSDAQINTVIERLVSALESASGAKLRA